MRSIEFDYIPFKGIYVPMIPVKIRSGDIWFERWAFVDSGATYSIFHPKELTGTGIDYKQGKKMMIVVGDGSFIPVNFIKLHLMIGDVEIETTIGFSEQLGVGFNLLGRKDIFERFKVCFSDSKKIVSFQEE
ncbi:MAG: hypothetical protein Q8P40_02860 [Nitrospirota bacterium]|nr:hypothetical protein [Nitrospirota bacterium]